MGQVLIARLARETFTHPKHFLFTPIVGWGPYIPEYKYTELSARFSRPSQRRVPPWGVDFESRPSCQTGVFFEGSMRLFWGIFVFGCCASETLTHPNGFTPHPSRRVVLIALMYDPYTIHVHEAALRHQMAQNEHITTRRVSSTFREGVGGTMESFAFLRQGGGGSCALL